MFSTIDPAMNETPLEFHPEAKNAIDERANALLTEVHDYIKQQTRPSFTSQRHPAAHFTDEDIIGEVLSWDTDQYGKKLSVSFSKGDKTYEIGTQAYPKLNALIDLILKIKWVAKSVSNSFLEVAIVDWCRDQIGLTCTTNFSDFVIARCESTIRKFVIWVPIAHFETAVAFDFGPARIDTISKAMMDKREEAVRSRVKNIDPTKLEQCLSADRRRLQGLGAVIVTLTAEREYAFVRAVEVADTAIGLLRCFSFEAMTTRSSCPSAILGSDYIPSTTALSFEDDGAFTMSRRLMSQATHWQISKAQLDIFESHGLLEMGALLSEGTVTEFQRTLRSSLLAFSKGVTLPDVNDRLVYTFSALEGLLLRGNEPIQQNIGERMAFILERDADARKAIVRNTKEAYQLRSQYIHHRISSAEEDVLETFARNAHGVLISALGYAGKFKTKNDLLDAIDDIKFRT